MMPTWMLLMIGSLCKTLLLNSPVIAQGTSSSPASPTTELTVNSTTPHPTPQNPQNIIACESNDQCPNGNLCLNHHCMDACHPGHCVKNVNCQAGGHRPSCICIPGTTDNLKVKCIALSSATFMPQPPIAGQPPFIIPDSLILAGAYTPPPKPPPIAEQPPITFPITYAYPKPISTPRPVPIGCENNDDCSTDNSCINKLCIDACGLGYCGEDADCQTSHHRPVCICPPGTTGNPLISCRALAYPYPLIGVTTEPVDSPPLPVTAPPLQPQPPITGQPPSHLDSLIIPEAGPPPRMIPPLIELPTQTFPRTTPTPRPPFYPIIVPVTIWCENNDDCTIDNICINKLCFDACSLGICGDDADCRTHAHRLVCTCPPGTAGDPLIGCNLLLTEHVERSTSLLTTPCYCL